MRFILQYPEATGSELDLLDAGSIPDLAQTAEAAGWDGIALTEHPAPSASWLQSGGHQSLDPFVALAAAGAVTTSMALVTGLSVLPYRNPLLLAKAAATLDRMSEGRFIMGAGAGYLKSEFFALGVNFNERNALLEEALEVMQLHWSGDPFSFEGRHFSAHNIQARPMPRNSRVPIWMGGNSDAALRRAARHADGWMPMTASASVAKTTRTPPVTTPEELAERRSTLERFAGDRYEELQLIMSYSGPSLTDFERDIEHIHNRFGEMDAMGVDWIIIGARWSRAPAPAEWVTAFGETFLLSRRRLVSGAAAAGAREAISREQQGHPRSVTLP
jgi:probable F420-dependent oxidoreductase